MTIHKCDICGKEMSVWLNITIGPDAVNPDYNISNLIKYCGRMEICLECYEKGMKQDI